MQTVKVKSLMYIRPSRQFIIVLTVVHRAVGQNENWLATNLENGPLDERVSSDYFIIDIEGLWCWILP